MPNERLRAAILAAGLTIDQVAARVGRDPKTVERWVATDGRLPHRAARRDVAKLLSVDEVHLWPSLAKDLKTSANTEVEVLELFPSRSAVPVATWLDLINGVSESMDVLVFSGQFLVEQFNILPIVRAKSKDGVQFRFLVGDETSSAVIQRGIEEGTTGGLEGRIQMMRRYLGEVSHLPGVHVKTHGTILYNSIYRFDDKMLVNGHAYGALAGQNPVLYLRNLPGGLLWEHYMRSFERVWAQGVQDAPAERG